MTRFFNALKGLICFIFGVIVTLSSVGCKDDEPTIISVEGVSINKISVSLLEGDSEKLSATVSPSNAPNLAVYWSSSDIKVVSVDGQGNITALAPGTAVVTVTTVDGGKTATCQVTVEAKPIPITKGAYKHVSYPEKS